MIEAITQVNMMYSLNEPIKCVKKFRYFITQLNQ